MFKNKIAFRLSMSFAIALLIFSVIIGSIFMILFRNHTMKINKDEMVTRATSMANRISGYIGNDDGQKVKGNLGAYIKFIEDIAGTDVWIIDDNMNLLTSSFHKGIKSKKYNYSDLPKNAEQIVNEVFQDRTVFSEDFSSILSQPTLTVGVPIKINEDKVVGVVLLHNFVKGTNEAILQGFKLLGVSIIVALFISFILSSIFSYIFTKPLRKMNNTALKLADGDYTVQNNMVQKDEIGQLANTMDILSKRLHIASEESEKLDKMRRDFVANISHELKTPVTVIRGSLEALVDHIVEEPEKIEEYHVQMLKESIFLQRLVGDLLDLSKLQNTDFIIEKTEIYISDVIEDVIRSARQLAKDKNIDIKLNIENKELKIDADYGRIRQMLMIIIQNAIKFSYENSEIYVMVNNENIIIGDYGVGIDKDELPYIFDRFHKIHSEQNKTGTGLGLAIAKEIANHHDIIINVESELGRGTKFILNLFA